LRVVFDTNVLISALCFPGGAPEHVYRLAIEGRIELATSPPLLAELGRILTDKFDWEPGRVEDAIAHVARIAVIVEPTESVAVVKADPADDRVLEAALACDADVIASGDSHLLKLGEWRRIRIVSCAQLLAET
jgi:putative PIN family toxin of toxin-antitoxin system